MCLLWMSKTHHNFTYIKLVLHFNWINVCVCVKASSSNLKCNRWGGETLQMHPTEICVKQKNWMSNAQYRNK